MITQNINGQTISSDFISALSDGNCIYNARLMLDGAEIDCSITSIVVTKGSCGSDYAFTVGNIFGSTMVARVQELNTAVKGEELELQIGVEINGQYEYISIGKFYIAKIQQNVNATTLTGYGATITRTGATFNVPSSKTLANIASSISATASALAGRTVNVTFGSGITTSKTITASMDNLTAYQALQVLAGVCGGFATDTADGHIKICRFSDTPTLARDNDSMRFLPEVEADNFEIEGVICVVSPATDTTPAVQFPATPTGAENLIVQNQYATQDLYNSYLATLAGYAYRPATIGLTYGDPRLEGDDVVQITDIDDSVYIVPCHTVTHTYTGSLSTQVVAVQATEEADDVATSAGGLTQQVSNIGASAISARASAESAKASADEALEYAEIAKETTDEINAYAETAGKTVTQILNDGETAGAMAQQAIADAGTAKTMAESATASATSALKGLSTVEDVVDTLNWIATHCEYEKTTDVTIVTGKAYYTVTATQVSSPTDADIVTYYELVSGEYVKTTDTAVVSGKTYYTVVGEPVTNPVVADIGTYYELEITEAVSNYINTHVAVTDEGLWLVPDDTQGSNKVLIAVGGTGHTYEQAGTYILDGTGDILARFLGTYTQIGRETLNNVFIDEDSVDVRSGELPVASFGVDGITMNGENNFNVLNILPSAVQSDVIATEYCKKGGRFGASYTIVGSATSGSILKVQGRYHIQGSAIVSFTKSFTYGTASTNTEMYYVTLKYDGEQKITLTANTSTALFYGVYLDSVSYHTLALLPKYELGVNVTAEDPAQCVMGKFNVASSDKAFVIGNGTADNARSNALTVDWGGDICLALDTTAQSGTTDGDLYTAITALGWQNDVVV